MNEKKYIKKCTSLVEEKLKWGDSKSWTHHDFETLSDKIYNETGIIISISTNKRLFGKKVVNEFYNPQTGTKNALAKFIGYEDWNDFKYKYDLLEASGSIEYIDDEKVTLSPKNANSNYNLRDTILSNPKKWLALFVILIVSAGTIYFFSFKPIEKEHVIPLTIKKLEGLTPYTYGFYYDVSSIEGDNILLDYGNFRNQPIVNKKHFFNYSYPIPDLYRPQIIADGDTLTKYSVHVTSDGWKGFIQEKPIDTIHYKGMLYLPKAKLKEITTSWINNEFFLEFRNIRNFNAIGDNYTVETKVKHANSNLQCCSIEFEVIGAKGRLWFMLVEPGCTHWVGVKFGDVNVNGRTSNLSALAQDIFKWNNLKVQVIDNTTHLYFNNKEIFHARSSIKIGALKGFIYRFKESGMVENIKLYNGQNKLVYKDDF